jgi:hypothetical protein
MPSELTEIPGSDRDAAIQWLNGGQVVVVAPAVAMAKQAPPPRLVLDRDLAELARVVWNALARQRQQLHQGRRCLATRSPVLAAWRRQPVREAWSQARVVSCAQSVLADRVRTRLSAAGLVARPERWLDQRSFLPDTQPAGRALLVALVVSAGYYTCIPTQAGELRLPGPVVAPLIDGIRKGAFATAVGRVWAEDEVAGLDDGVDRLGDAVESWRAARPELYAALVGLAEANRTVLSLDVPGLHADTDRPQYAEGRIENDVAEVVIEQYGRCVVDTEQVAAAEALLRRFLVKVAALSAGAPSQLRALLVDEAEALAREEGGPDWLWQLRERPAVVSALIERAADLF